VPLYMLAFKRALKILSVLLVMAGGWLTWFACSPVMLESAPGKPLDFTIPAGFGLSASAHQMAEAGVDFAPWQFTLLARILGKSSDIKAGSYEISHGITPLALLDKLTRGDVTQREVRFLEGMSFRQLRGVLDAHNDLRHDTAGWSDQDVLRRLGATEMHPEGLFFPDTYLFARGGSDLEILRRAYHSMQRALAVEWSQRTVGLPLKSPYEALILASIIEKETGQAADRPLIASVFINRLRRGMLLQTDPTVIYGLGAGFDGNLRKRDLQGDTPYNSYLHPGLPPTPIAMPGLAALRAALNPVHSDHLYFVARGDGSSEFSRTLDEHNRAVNKYQRGSSS
jgi:UPF0755 protein